MSSVNKVILVGHLGKDPEFRQAGDKEVASMSLATSETYKDNSGERQKKTQWHRLSAWISINFIRDYLHKGDCIYVEGKLEYREWTDKDGKKQTTAEVNVLDIRPIASVQSETQPANRNSRPSTQQQRPAQRETQVHDEDFAF